MDIDLYLIKHQLASQRTLLRATILYNRELADFLYRMEEIQKAILQVSPPYPSSTGAQLNNPCPAASYLYIVENAKLQLALLRDPVLVRILCKIEQLSKAMLALTAERSTSCTKAEVFF